MWRSNPKLRSIGRYVVLILLCCLGVRLWLGGELTLYIHPRYIWFTVVASVCAILICLGGIWYALKQNTHAQHPSKPVPLRISVVSLITCIVLGAALIVPPQILLSAAAEQRAANVTLPQNKTGEQCIDITERPPQLLQDWEAVLENCPDVTKYQGKPIRISGFVRPLPDEAPEDAVLVSRFVVSCCAVDARPVDLPVQLNESEERYPRDSWIEVEGTLQPGEVDGKLQLIVQADSVKRIPQPKDPYEFLQPIPYYEQ